MVAAGIVLYNPDQKRLDQNIESILPQVDKLILIENGSTEFDYLNQFESDKFIKIVNKENKGIAFALNQILIFCYQNGIDWVLTLDQDSIASKNIIDVYRTKIDSCVGIVCCDTVDRNFTERNVEKSNNTINYCITSGSFTNVKACVEVGGFDNSMFIDWVDWDICIALRKAGYKIIKTSETNILHELGDNSSVKYIGKHALYVLNRSPFRYYYVFRNRVYLARKYDEMSISHAILINIKECVSMFIFESNRLKNLRAMVKGTFNGFKMNIIYDSIQQMLAH